MSPLASAALPTRPHPLEPSMLSTGLQEAVPEPSSPDQHCYKQSVDFQEGFFLTNDRT